MNFRIFAVLALFASIAHPLLAQEAPKVAVYVTGEVSENEKKALGTRMLASIVNSGRYRGADAGAFLAEAGKLASRGAVDDGKISELGRRFGIDAICIAEITPVFGDFQVSARIINAQTAAMEFIGEYAGSLKSIDDLAKASDSVVRGMFGGKARPSQPAPKPAAAQEPSTPIQTATAPAPAQAVDPKPESKPKPDPKPEPKPEAESTSTPKPEPAPKAKAEPKPDAEQAPKPESDPAPSPKAKPKPAPKAQAKPDPATEPGQDPSAEPAPAAEASAQSIGGIRMSAGTGAIAAINGGGGIKWESTGEQIAMPQASAGAYFFFDATYAALTVAIQSGSGKWKSNGAGASDLPDMQQTSIALGLYAKYPIPVTPYGYVVAFPLLGIDYEISTSAKLVRADKSEYKFDGKDARPKAGDLSATWVKFGAGVDAYLIENLYIRADVLYGVRMANAFEMEGVDNGQVPGTTMLGNGVTIRVGVGYRL